MEKSMSPLTDTEKSEIKDLKQDNKTHVTWTVFNWAIAVIILIMGWLITANNGLSNRIEAMQTTYTEIRTQLSQIQTDIEWIKLKK